MIFDKAPPTTTKGLKPISVNRKRGFHYYYYYYYFGDLLYKKLDSENHDSQAVFVFQF